jgi:hypothetical protein
MTVLVEPLTLPLPLVPVDPMEPLTSPVAV